MAIMAITKERIIINGNDVEGVVVDPVSVAYFMATK